MALTNTENLRDEIDKQFRLYVDGIKIRTKCNLNDGAVNGEGFFCNFFNLLFGFKLSKDKIESAYNETIDLHDIEGKRCVQVTARNDKPKVETTINHFVKKKRYELYKELHFIIIDREILFKHDANALLKYGVTIIFHDYTTIFQTLKDKFDSYDKIKPIYDFIISELDPNKLKNDTIGNSANSKTKSNLFQLNNELHLVDQILEYLKLFEGFNFIHPRTISRLPIFNSKESFHDSYSHFCLNTSNSILY